MCRSLLYGVLLFPFHLLLLPLTAVWILPYESWCHLLRWMCVLLFCFASLFHHSSSLSLSSSRSLFSPHFQPVHTHVLHVLIPHSLALPVLPVPSWMAVNVQVSISLTCLHQDSNCACCHDHPFFGFPFGKKVDLNWQNLTVGFSWRAMLLAHSTGVPPTITWCHVRAVVVTIGDRQPWLSIWSCVFSIRIFKHIFNSKYPNMSR